MFELVKNSLRAVYDRFDTADDEPPPIRLVVAEGEEDITIKARAVSLCCLCCASVRVRVRVCVCVCGGRWGARYQGAPSAAYAFFSKTSCAWELPCLLAPLPACLLA